MHILLDVGVMNDDVVDLLLAMPLKNVDFPFPEATNYIYI